jgi:hypothetical protein
MKLENFPMKMCAFFQARRALIFIDGATPQAIIISFSLTLPRKICGGGLGGGFICQSRALPWAKIFHPSRV